MSTDKKSIVLVARPNTNVLSTISKSWECRMRRSYTEVADLVSARRQDYINGDASEAVYRASLKALGLSQVDIENELDNAAADWVKHAKISHEDKRMKNSLDWINEYLARKAS